MAQINLSGSISTTGTAILGTAAVVFATDANHTLSVAEYTNYFLEVTSFTSLTTQRNLIAPLVQGQSFIIQNKTTGGQSIQVIGSSGTGITVPNGLMVAVVCDGVNYLEISGGSGSGSITFQPGGTTFSNVFTTQAALQSAVSSIFGPTTVYLDFSSAGDTFALVNNLTLGANTTLAGVINQLTGSPPDFQTDGYTISGIVEIENTHLIVTGIQTTTSLHGNLNLRNTLLESGDGNYFISVTNTYTVNMYDGSVLGDGTNAVLHVASGGILTINLFDSSSINNIVSSITVAGGGSLIINRAMGGDVTGSTTINTVGQRKSFLLMGA